MGVRKRVVEPRHIFTANALAVIPNGQQHINADTILFMFLPQKVIQFLTSDHCCVMAFESELL